MADKWVRPQRALLRRLRIARLSHINTRERTGDSERARTCRGQERKKNSHPRKALETKTQQCERVSIYTRSETGCKRQAREQQRRRPQKGASVIVHPAKLGEELAIAVAYLSPLYSHYRRPAEPLPGRYLRRALQNTSISDRLRAKDASRFPKRSSLPWPFFLCIFFFSLRTAHLTRELRGAARPV